MERFRARAFDELRFLCNGADVKPSLELGSRSLERTRSLELADSLGLAYMVKLESREVVRYFR